MLLSAALWGAFGVGVGAVIQSQTSALVIAILWILVVEALVRALLGLVDLARVGDYLPGAALASFEGERTRVLTPLGRRSRRALLGRRVRPGGLPPHLSSAT